MICDYFRVTGAHDTVLDSADSLLLFVMITPKNPIQDGMTFYYQCQRFHPMMSWKVRTNRGYVSLRNSELFWNCTTWRFIRKYRCPLSKIEGNGKEKCRSETPITKR